jgi:hypothetical protein
MAGKLFWSLNLFYHYGLINLIYVKKRETIYRSKRNIFEITIAIHIHGT